jgi:hypothetical protein
VIEGAREQGRRQGLGKRSYLAPSLLAGLVAVDEENYDAERLPPNTSPAAK